MVKQLNLRDLLLLVVDTCVRQVAAPVGRWADVEIG
jgi:hypothetical protein